MTDDDADEFWGNVDVRLSFECWLWTAGRCGKDQRYGRWGRNTLAHRHAWSLHHGEDPGERWCGHWCGNTLCCNPSHIVCADPKTVLAATPGWRNRKVS
jgi:hypothetical protein